MEHLPGEHIALIQKALDVYASDKPIDENERKTGGATWDKSALLSYRDYARSEVDKHGQTLSYS